MKTRTMVPFVKWVGGKRQLMAALFNIFNKFDFKRLHEPFVGGGAMFIEALNRGVEVATINDLNSELVNTYKSIRDCSSDLIKELDRFERNHNRFSYYIARDLDRHSKYFNLKDYIRAARFIYLNKTGFNGIYRVNNSGMNNVPIGAIWEKKVYDKKNILELSSSFKTLKHINNGSYEYILEHAVKGDLVYFDPPYDKFENEDNFVGYQKEGFTRENQEELKLLCDKLIANGVNVVVSNHNTTFIRELYKNQKYYIHEVVSATRNLNSDAKNRSAKPIEVIIYGGGDLNEK